MGLSLIGGPSTTGPLKRRTKYRKGTKKLDWANSRY